MLKRTLRLTSGAGLAAISAGGVALYVDAPHGDRGDGQYVDPTGRADRCPEWLHDLGRLPIIGIATAVSKIYLHYLNETTIEGGEILRRCVAERPRKAALITVSNHTATVDDPSIFATIMPWKYALPARARWGLVSQEYSYMGSGLLRTFFFGAKALPIKRGAGIDQPMLAAAFDKVQEGAWFHIFPEGKIEQNKVLGGRSGPRVAEIGLLKWGVGKLIARADVRPIVVPIYHINMQQIMPQDENNRIKSMVPRTGVQIGIRVGEPIDFEDLFREHAAGRLAAAEAKSWTTEPQEEALYSAITKRIEDKLMELATRS